MTGQLNMFDLIHSLEDGAPGEVEMVSLVPIYEEEPEILVKPEEVVEPEVVEEPEIEVEPEIEAEPEIVEEPEAEAEPEVEAEPEIVEEPEIETKPQFVISDEKVAMSRRYEIDGEMIEIAYINYNKVRISKGNGVPEIIEFASTKEAVDYYVEKILEAQIDE